MLAQLDWSILANYYPFGCIFFLLLSFHWRFCMVHWTTHFVQGKFQQHRPVCPSPSSPMIDVSPCLKRVSDCPSLLSPSFNTDSNHWPAAEREMRLLIFPAALANICEWPKSRVAQWGQKYGESWREVVAVRGNSWWGLLLLCLCKEKKRQAAGDLETSSSSSFTTAEQNQCNRSGGRLVGPHRRLISAAATAVTKRRRRAWPQSTTDAALVHLSQTLQLWARAPPPAPLRPSTPVVCFALYTRVLLPPGDCNPLQPSTATPPAFKYAA